MKPSQGVLMKGNRISFIAGWGAIDSNAHMANTAYLDFAADSRFTYFKENGFPGSEFSRRGIGPVVRKDEIEYFREYRLLEKGTVELKLAGISEDGSRFRLANLFYTEDGILAAVIKSTGGWLDLRSRTLTCPPAELLELLRALSKTDDYEPLPSSVKVAC